jgi:hypothetical protein
MAFLVEHSPARDIENAAGDDAADFPLGVGVDDG